MAYALIAHTVTAGASATPAIDTTGVDLIVLVVSGTVTSTPTDSKGNTWTARTQYSAHAGSYGNTQIYYCQAPSVGSGHTFTGFSPNPSDRLFVAAFSGSVATPFDVENGNGTASSGTSFQGGSVSPSSNNQLIVSGLVLTDLTSTTSIAVDSGFTITDSVMATATVYGCALAYLIETTATAKNPTWTWDVSGNVAVANATFKASGGGGAAALIQPSRVGRQAVNRASTY